MNITTSSLLNGYVIGVTALLITFSGCAHIPPEPRCASFGAADYCLQLSTQSYAATQLVERTDAKGVEHIVVYLEVNGGDARMVGVTPFGRRLWQIRFDGAEVVSDIPASVGLNAQHILAGLQLLSLPLAQARAGVRGTTARLVESPDGSERKLLAGDTVVLSAKCEGERPTCRRAELRYETLRQSLRIEVVEGSTS
jgi:uncharacterized protein DUF3261